MPDADAAFDVPANAEPIVSAGTRPRGQEPSALQVRIVPRAAVTPDLIAQWRDLESRSLHPSIFLSPDFLLPAWRWIEPGKSSFLMTVAEPESGRLLALGCFESVFASRHFPLPHLLAAKTIHTFRTHLLVDVQAGEAALDAWLSFIARNSRWHGVIFPNLRLDSQFARQLEAAAKRQNAGWHVQGSADSAAVFTPVLTLEETQAFCSKSRRKSLRRNQKYLESFGKLHFSHVTHADDLPDAINTFLELEDSGWKGIAGTSMRHSPSETAFLKELSTGFFERGRLAVTQLRVGDNVAATAVNLMSDTTLFAFKIAWDPQLKKGGPGSLHELFLVAHILKQFPQITCVDSCAAVGSYLEHLWPHRIPIGQVAITSSRLADTLVRALDAGRRLRQRLQRWW